MESLNQMEIQSIRHICGMATTTCTKIKYYRTLTTDNQVMQVLDDFCTNATSLKNELCNLL